MSISSMVYRCNTELDHPFLWYRYLSFVETTIQITLDTIILPQASNAMESLQLLLISHCPDTIKPAKCITRYMQVYYSSPISGFRVTAGDVTFYTWLAPVRGLGPQMHTGSNWVPRMHTGAD